MKTGIELIAEERTRQIEKEGWTPDHDSEHRNGELALAAVGYALPDADDGEGSTRYGSFSDGMPRFWPWNKQWWKPSPANRVRELVKAGALIAAEIDRLQATK